MRRREECHVQDGVLPVASVETGRAKPVGRRAASPHSFASAGKHHGPAACVTRMRRLKQADDSTSDMSQQMQLELQMAMDRRSKVHRHTVEYRKNRK